MIYKIEFFELKYPKNYTPGDGYKKTMIAKTWLTDYSVSRFGVESALWKAAARCRITGKVTDFRMYEFGEVQPCFLGSM